MQLLPPNQQIACASFPFIFPVPQPCQGQAQPFHGNAQSLHLVSARARGVNLASITAAFQEAIPCARHLAALVFATHSICQAASCSPRQEMSLLRLHHRRRDIPGRTTVPRTTKAEKMQSSLEETRKHTLLLVNTASADGAMRPNDPYISIHWRSGQTASVRRSVAQCRTAFSPQRGRGPLRVGETDG